MTKYQKNDMRILMGDFKVQMKRKQLQRCGDMQTIHEKTINNVELLCNFAATTDMYIVSTMFKHEKDI